MTWLCRLYVCKNGTLKRHTAAENKQIKYRSSWVFFKKRAPKKQYIKMYDRETTLLFRGSQAHLLALVMALACAGYSDLQILIAKNDDIESYYHIMCWVGV